MSPSLWWAVAGAAVLNLDRQAFGQLGFSRPLVSTSLVGLLIGRPLEGLTLGLWTEMLWMNRSPLGGHILPNGGLASSAAILGLAAALQAAAADPKASEPAVLAALLVMALILTPPLASLMSLVEITSRRRAAVQARDFEAALTAGYDPSALYLQLSSLASTLGLTLAFLVVGAVLTRGLMILSLSRLPFHAWALLSKGALIAPLAALACMSDNLLDRGRALIALALVVVLGLCFLGFRP